MGFIPEGADVAASKCLAPQVTRRCRVFRIARPCPSYGRNGRSPNSPGPSVASLGSERGTVRPLALWGYRAVVNGGGIILHHLPPLVIALV
ncbi:hypothetical protein GCM10010187_69250 [Actinomadura coerulea]|nr:hypothetical protein GCM10010187_69250 [Actinomadura coerulea]